MAIETTAEIVRFHVERASVYETCVYPPCGGLTDVRRDTHVNLRPYHIEGVGEFHPDCYRMYVEETMEWVRSLEKEREERIK